MFCANPTSTAGPRRVRRSVPGPLAALLALLPAAGLGASAEARARGVVEDAAGAPIAGARVTVRRAEVGFSASVASDGEGRFALAVPVAAHYDVSASAEGYAVARQSVRLPLPPGEETLRLVLRPGTFTDQVTVIATRLAGSEETIERLPGSVATIDREALDTSRVFNVTEALRKAPGVLVRDEEGFSLRPNIGIRGLNPTRSSKVLLLEDGLFLTFAPYGDNATYYHPPIERFESIEVVKGAGQIAYGPVTVGGVINYLTPSPPPRTSGNLRLLGGNRDLWSAQATGGGTWGRTALLAEYLYKEGAGARDNVFAELDDLNLKAVFTASDRQTLTVKGSYYGEDSQVTYSGLTLGEWQQDPRQNPFENDGMDAERRGLSLKHTWLRGQTLVTTHLYTSGFSRDWWRQSSNSGQRPNDRSDPACGGMANLLTTCGNEGRLRNYELAGIEPRLRFALPLFAADSEAEAGVRAHFETQERRQVNGNAPTARSGVLVEDNRRENDAYSAFFQDRLLFGKFTLSTGVRFESVRYRRTNRLANAGAGASGSTDLTQWVPGVGVSYAATDRLTLFAGAHRGFAPPRTEDIISNSGGTVDLDAERSWNYELGVRSQPRSGLRLEATLFRNDYQNQIVPATLSGGVGATLTNGGATLHEGLEVGARLDLATLLGDAPDLFVRVAFTALPTARFEGVRTSSVAGQSAVDVSGNRLPYAPETTLSAALGYRHPRGFSAQLEAVAVSEQSSDDLNTVASSADGQRGTVPSYTIWNLALSYQLSRFTLFATAKNLDDRLYLVDRSRGMIPGPPRLVQLGVATRF